ncbi:hypothetical protein MNB_SUP05-11-652 [hydrothermal vent metagenome]|uniref:Uncharacterized protein n=1 Tax=hydrothermal vent metagenome TaxID=652676 RepID=A0A1W1DDM5_9ZZZZ
MIFGNTPANKRHRTANIFNGFNLIFMPLAFNSHKLILSLSDLLAVIVSERT